MEPAIDTISIAILRVHEDTRDPIWTCDALRHIAKTA